MGTWKRIREQKLQKGGNKKIKLLMKNLVK
jgi:hypothetical protein